LILHLYRETKCSVLPHDLFLMIQVNLLTCGLKVKFSPNAFLMSNEVLHVGQGLLLRALKSDHIIAALVCLSTPDTDQGNLLS
jgi:hypothetical protein